MVMALKRRQNKMFRHDGMGALSLWLSEYILLPFCFLSYIFEDIYVTSYINVHAFYIMLTVRQSYSMGEWWDESSSSFTLCLFVVVGNTNIPTAVSIMLLFALLLLRI